MYIALTKFRYIANIAYRPSISTYKDITIYYLPKAYEKDDNIKGNTQEDTV